MLVPSQEDSHAADGGRWQGAIGSPELTHPRQSHVGTTTMIEALKSDAIVNKLGGRFKLCTLVQRRLEQLIDGARPLVDRDGRSDLEVVIEEIMQDKITLEWDPSTLLRKDAQ
jgi:DNA-directed RNA polymerase subunit omega